MGLAAVRRLARSSGIIFVLHSCKQVDACKSVVTPLYPFKLVYETLCFYD